VTSDELRTSSYKDLIAWQKGIKLVKLVYDLTRSFPGEEKFGLISQMRRSAVSIPSNLAEGQARRTTGEFVQFVSHAEGSLAELDTQFVIAIELEYCTQQEAQASSDLIIELRKMLNSLRRKLSQK
jgi:four helix bundle protein